MVVEGHGWHNMKMEKQDHEKLKEMFVCFCLFFFFCFHFGENKFEFYEILEQSRILSPFFYNSLFTNIG